MRVVVAHENLDFDALGSMVLAGRLFPGSVLALIGGLEGPLKEIAPLLEDRLDLVPAAEIPVERVTEVVLVDNARPERIGPFKALVGRVPFLVFDHHPRAPGDVPAVGGRVAQVGATVSLLIPLIRERGLTLTPLEATLAYAGIWEDTGGFSFPSTTPQDLEAAYFLAQQGAEIPRVREWVRPQLGEEAREVLKSLIRTAKVVERQGFRLLLARAQEEGYVPALAPLAHALLDLHEAHGVLLVLRLAREVLLIARSRERLDVGRWLSQVGGGGHPRAAFARVRGVRNAVRRLLESLPQYLEPESTLAEVMSAPVETLRPTTVREALRILEERGYGAMPVVEPLEGGRVRVLGLARRRDLRKAERLGLAEYPVEGFLARALVLPPETPLSEVEPHLKAGGGRVLVGERLGEGVKLLGIFTRTDLYRKKPALEKPLGERILEALPEGARRVVLALRKAFPQGIYLVGGAVRDALLDRSGPDLDLVLEPGVRVGEVARFLVERFGGSFGLHYAFGTARVRVSFGLTVDLAESREEVYPYPGALPQVRPAPIAKDLERRDYTVNAMALSLATLELLDPYGGLEDLRNRLLRPLHPLSFVEDPSRIVRGARLAARLAFRFSEEALKALPPALLPEVLKGASKSRLRDELFLTLEEDTFLEALSLLEELGALGPLYGLKLPPRDPFVRLRWGPLEDEGFPPGRARVEARLLLLLYFQENPLEKALALGLPKRLQEALALLLKGSWEEVDKEALGKEPLRGVFLALFPGKEGWLTEKRRVLMGRDLLQLGLKPGPRVGEILRQVAEARARGEVRTFEEELALARRLIGDGSFSVPQ
ncbi:CBS domain-containing protein [Thermus scotoductus]|uniref:Polya polymerase n=12 Tax=Thermus scotoductus TaxID=37636 RepID=A0A430SC26_THESC|nr:CBS domain-containing protein [Thermus scotoductus]RTH31389.1 polya polymerase [Thermus scotoductus]RTH33888.1 polya polymerase [Thermus scotoductus]RTI11741.1 polya polymerase [Thermus scotoductus]RTI23932.1 polya polymerase [Thermus scotoductus]